MKIRLGLFNTTCEETDVATYTVTTRKGQTLTGNLPTDDAIRHTVVDELDTRSPTATATPSTTEWTTVTGPRV